MSSPICCSEREEEGNAIMHRTSVEFIEGGECASLRSALYFPLQKSFTSCVGDS